MISDAVTDLIIYACLAANPSICERTVVPTMQPVEQCTASRPAILAQWRRDNPDMRAKRIKCRKHMADA